MSDIIDFGNQEFVHLGLGATTVPLPRHTGDGEWYMQYGQDTAADGAEGRLVSMHTFTESWTEWEVHPHGTELVLCVAGDIVLHQEHLDGTTGSVTLAAGQAAINAPGVWHTADIPDGAGPATVIFITAGQGTDGRPR